MTRIKVTDNISDIGTRLPESIIFVIGIHIIGFRLNMAIVCEGEFYCFSSGINFVSSIFPVSRIRFVIKLYGTKQFKIVFRVVEQFRISSRFSWRRFYGNWQFSYIV